MGGVSQGGTLRHQLMDDGAVFVTLQTRGGDRHVARLPASEVKRFAWAVLSDLDPDGADEAQAKGSTGGPGAPRIWTHDWARGHTIYRVGAAIAEGHTEARNIARALGYTNTNATSVRLSHLRGEGLADYSMQGVPLRPVWRLTESGRSWLAEYRAAELAVRAAKLPPAALHGEVREV